MGAVCGRSEVGQRQCGPRNVPSDRCERLRHSAWRLTYPAERPGDLLEPILCGRADMAVGSRLNANSQSRFRILNRVGNRLFACLLNVLFRQRLSDILSGYGAFSRRFVESVSPRNTGSEIEAELTIAALRGGFRFAKVPVSLSPRPEGSRSRESIPPCGDATRDRDRQPPQPA